MTKKFALVLGGTKGLGKELSRQLIERQTPVIVVGRSAGPQDGESKSPLLTSLSCDLLQLTSVERLLSELARLISDGSQITEFYWAAGRLDRQPFSSIETKSMLSTVDINFRNPLIVAQWVWRHMQSLQGTRRFVVISSTVGISDSPREDEAIYAATKAAQVSFARAIGKTHTSDSLLVSLFCPGGMKMDLWKSNAVDVATYDSFLDPEKVAAKICSMVESQTEPYQETIIPRGSL